jgi:hypothetical protein
MMGRILRRMALAGTVLALVGCGPASPRPSAPNATASPRPSAPNATSSPDLVRPFADGYGRVWRLLVYDPNGLLGDVQQATRAEFPEEPGETNISWAPIVGSPDSLGLVWMGGVCTTDRVLAVAQQGPHLSLAVFEGHNRQLAPNEACPGVGIIYRLRLTFRQPIADFDFALSFRELPQ